MDKVNKHARYIQVFDITIFNTTITLSLGNPKWFIQEIKNMIKEGE